MARAAQGVTEFVDVRGVKVRLLRGGTGPPLLFLHGAGRTGDWLPFHHYLSEFFSVYAPDHPGFGRSDRPDWLHGMDDLVYHYLDFLDLMKLETVAVVGASFGGWLAAELGVAHPERISKLVLIGASGLRVEGAPVTDLFLLSHEELVEHLFADPNLIASALALDTPPEVERELYRGKYTLAHLGWNPLMQNPALRRRLYRISSPALVLWGEKDRLVPIAHGEAYAAGIPDAILSVIPGCGHAVPLEKPKEAARAITEFLSD